MYCDVGSRCVPQNTGVQGKPSLAFVTNGWLCASQPVRLGELRSFNVASPKHARRTAWQRFVRHGGLCLYSSLIYARLTEMASLPPSFLPSGISQRQLGLLVKRCPCALDPLRRATGPKHMVGMQGARQSAQKQHIVSKPPTDVTLTHRLIMSQWDDKVTRWGRMFCCVAVHGMWY